MDKYRDITRIPIAEARLGLLLNRLSSNLSIGGYQTQEELVRAYADIAARLSEGHDKRIFDLPKVSAGSPANETSLNLFLLGLYSEILYLVSSTKNTSKVSEANFNFAISKLRKLQADLKYCKQQLATYVLYTKEFGDFEFVGETFSNENNIDRGSEFLDEKECFINLAEGTISLPKKGEDNSWDIKSLEIGANSNGVLGNNVEAKKPIRGQLKAMYDGNVDTWTEYERVVDQEDGSGLKLELKISLGELKVVNAVKIHPVFFGARTPVSIISIDVSPDGRTWIDLKNDVRVADFLDEDSESRYHLSPHSSKFAGEFNITFAPYFVKFVRILLKQTSSVPITDVYGIRRLRYAIGVKEVQILGNEYEAAGELVSKSLLFNRDIFSAGILSLVDPPGLAEQIGGVEYFLSSDDGASWTQITSLQEASVDTPEVYNPLVGAQSLRYKVRLSKDETAFEAIAQNIPARPFREVHGWDDRVPQEIPLFHKPEPGTISVCTTGVLSRGRFWDRRVIGKGIDSAITDVSGTLKRVGGTQLRLRVPLKTITDVSDFYLFVGSQLWERVGSESDFSTVFSHQYILRRADDSLASATTDWEVVFGNDDADTPSGRIPAATDPVSIVLGDENLAVEGLLSPYTVKLDYPTDGQKENVEIRFRNNTLAGGQTDTFPGGKTSYKLSKKNVLIGEARGRYSKLTISLRDAWGTFIGVQDTDNYNVAPPATIAEYVTFINGESELDSPGKWTVDLRDGKIYFQAAISASYEITVSYNWEDIRYLRPTDWDFAEGSVQEIQIYNSGYFTTEATVTIPSGVRYLSLVDESTNKYYGVVTKSMRINSSVTSPYIPHEVPFIDGVEEFEERGKLQDEDVPQAVSGIDSIASFRLTHWEDLIQSAGIFFDERDSGTTYFLNEVPNYESLSSTGDYFIDTIGDDGPLGKGYVYVQLSTPGAVMDSGVKALYHYRDAYSYERTRGAYSVNLRDGEIYFATPTAASGTATFKYTPYIARYNVSNVLTEDEDFEVGDKRITISKGSPTDVKTDLVVSYKYKPETEKFEDLAPYFSPLLRALAVKVS